MIKDAMVLAAGLGTRMRPITNTIPKPLVTVDGKTLLDHALDALVVAGVKKANINVHYLADQIENHIETRLAPEISISDERERLLDSGGGVKKAIHHLPSGPFFILNADSFWIDADRSALQSMNEIWNDDSMDMLLLVTEKDNAVGFDGKGDFFMDESGRLTRRGNAESAPFIYAGAIVAKAQKFQLIPEEKFSLNQMFDEAILNNALYGCPLDGLWLHVGTPQSIPEAEAAISSYNKRSAP